MSSELEEKISRLESRIIKLEKVENRRRIKKIVGISIKVIILLVVLYFGYRYYQHVNETYIKPYKETIDKLDNGYNRIKDSAIFSKLFG